MPLRWNTIILANILLACTFVNAVAAETMRSKIDLQGPVRTVTTTAYGRSEIETYDQAGHLVGAVITLAHGNTSTHYVFHYNQQGHLLEEVAVDPNGQLIYRKQFAYGRDTQGRETASVAASDDGELLHVEFSLYDRVGNLAEQLLFYNTTIHRSLFDVLGRVIYSAWYSKGELFSELRHTYNEEGRLKEVTSYSAAGVMTGRVVSEYDSSGHRVRAITEKFQARNSRTWITTYEYDGMGNWIKEVTTEAPSTSRHAEPATTPIVQTRIIEYYDASETNRP